MTEDCVFKCLLGNCPVKQKHSRRQPDGARMRNIIDAIWMPISITCPKRVVLHKAMDHTTTIHPTLLVMQYVLAEREGDFHLRHKVVEESLLYFFSAGHINYARYGVHYRGQMEALPEDIRARFDTGEHAILLNTGIWNRI